MLIIAGSIRVAPEGRDAYLEGCAEVVRQARAAEGCLDFTLSADLLDAGRVNIYERWETADALDRFRGSGPPDDQSAAILDASVARYLVAGVEAP